MIIRFKYLYNMYIIGKCRFVLGQLDSTKCTVFQDLTIINLNLGLVLSDYIKIWERANINRLI